MTLRQKQSFFARSVAHLILQAYALGYEVTLGEAWRSPEEAQRLSVLGKGIVNSLHTKKLAIDLNLFKDGMYLSSTESHQPLGEWWEAQTTPELTFRWGGRFSRADGNHYELAP